MNQELINQIREKLNVAFNGVPGTEGKDISSLSAGAGESILERITSQLKGGNISSLFEMFSGKHTPEDDNAVNDLEEPVSNDLFNKLGVSKKTAGILAAIAIPIILNMFNNRVKEQKQNDGFDIGDLFKSRRNRNNPEVNDANDDSKDFLGNLIRRFVGR